MCSHLYEALVMYYGLFTVRLFVGFHWPILDTVSSPWCTYVFLWPVHSADACCSTSSLGKTAVGVQDVVHVCRWEDFVLANLIIYFELTCVFKIIWKPVARMEKIIFTLCILFSSIYWITSTKENERTGTAFDAKMSLFKVPTTPLIYLNHCSHVN